MTGREHHGMRAGGRHSHDRRHVLPGRIHNYKSFLGKDLPISNYFADHGTSCLMNTAQRFLFQSRDPPCDIAGRRISASRILPDP